ncbi:MAG: DMT family transporter [Rhodocyclales bacterium]|nr:DMT family transporter [Rhodocyclales bacterium]
MRHSRAVALMVLVTLLWSIAGVVTRQLDAARSFELTFWRSLFNALTLLVILVPLRGAALFRDILAGNRVIWFSGLCWATMYTAFMVALTLTSVANVLVTMASGPLLTALAARLFLGQRLPTRTWAAIGAAGLGIAWMFGAEAMRGASLTGSLVALGVPLASSANFTLLQQRAGAARASGVSQDMLPAVLLGALLSAAVTLPLAWPLQASGHDIGLLALLGAVQLAIPCLLVVRLSRELPAPEIALLALLEVIFGVLLAWVGANEVPSGTTLAGGALVLGALATNHLAGRR